MAAQFNIDNIINELYKDKKGFFVEVGVSDPIDQNNTYLLEQNGWSGILIEPSTKHNSRYSTIRPNSIIENVALVSKDYKEDFIYFNDSFSENHGFTSTVSEKNGKDKVSCATLNTILLKHNIKHIDFLSIDVEGYEIEVMNGINVDDFDIETIIIELHNTVENIEKGKISKHVQNYGYDITLNSFDYLCEKYNKSLLESGNHLLFTKKK